MKISYGPVPTREQWNDFKKLVKRYGTKRAKVINKRLADLQAADTLEVMRTLPGHCHELKGDRKWQLALDLEQPYRLIFKVDMQPIPTKSDTGLDWSLVTAIRIMEVVDYHD